VTSPGKTSAYQTRRKREGVSNRTVNLELAQVPQFEE
jgi:hypothetical protein